jgi:citrate lyase subunit beta/citryl-CoA lyase
VETEWFRDDIVLGAQAGVCAVMVPKIESADQVGRVAGHLPTGMPILPFIESAVGFDHSSAIAQAAHVERLVFGSLDFQVDLGLQGDGEETLYFRSHLVFVSRLAGIQPPVDGVWTSIDDPTGLRADTMRGRRLGFGGKLCIHPLQVVHVNACFRPSDEQVNWAQRVMEAVLLSKGSAVQVDGGMVDVPVIRKAEAILAEVKLT